MHAIYFNYVATKARPQQRYALNETFLTESIARNQGEQATANTLRAALASKGSRSLRRGERPRQLPATFHRHRNLPEPITKESFSERRRAISSHAHCGERDPSRRGMAVSAFHRELSVQRILHSKHAQTRAANMHKHAHTVRRGAGGGEETRSAGGETGGVDFSGRTREEQRSPRPEVSGRFPARALPQAPTPLKTSCPGTHRRKDRGFHAPRKEEEEKKGRCRYTQRDTHTRL